MEAYVQSRLLAQIALYIAVLVPVVSDEILGLRGLDIGWWGWSVTLIGPCATVVLCELAKIITYFQVRQYQGKLLKKRQAAEAKQETGSVDDTLPALIRNPSDPAM